MFELNIDFLYSTTEKFSAVCYQEHYFVLVKHKRDKSCTAKTAMQILMTTEGTPSFGYSRFPLKSATMLTSRTLSVEFVNNCIDRYNHRFGKKKVEHIESLPSLEWEKHSITLNPFRDFKVV